MTCSPVCSKHLSQWLIGRDMPCLGCGIMTPNPTQYEAGTIRLLASGGPLRTLLPLGAGGRGGFACSNGLGSDLASIGCFVQDPIQKRL